MATSSPDLSIFSRPISTALFSTPLTIIAAEEPLWFYTSQSRMEEILGRMLENLGNRVGGPMTPRFVLQPAVAVFLGARDGLRLGRAGTSILRWRSHLAPGAGRTVIRGMWRSVRFLVLVALILDLIYQVIVQGSLYPGETVIVGLTITLVPYLVVCAVVSACTCRKSGVHER